MEAHLSKVQVAIFEIVAQKCGTLIDGHIITDVDEIKVRQVDCVQEDIPSDASTLLRRSPVGQAANRVQNIQMPCHLCAGTSRHLGSIQQVFLSVHCSSLTAS
jgi:hypothetical protein